MFRGKESEIQSADTKCVKKNSPKNYTIQYLAITNRRRSVRYRARGIFFDAIIRDRARKKKLHRTMHYRRASA